MVSFSSLEFLFRFLPIFLIAYFVVPAKYREIMLLIGSLVFYAVGEPVFLLLLILATVMNYYMGMKAWELGEGYTVQPWRLQKRKQIVIAAVVIDVLILAAFKCLSAFVDNALLPLGISFYIFKMISFQADILRGEIWNKPKFKYVALYFTMFPQVVSGPIMRYNEGEFDLDRTCGLEQFEDGLKYFILGLGMKVLLADRLAILWNDLQMIGFQSISTPLAWLGAAGYSLRLYFDFWGYSLMASGLMVMLGYDFIENFNHPYASKSISEFYRRWHVTLGSWFRDYVYIPLGGSRCDKKRIALNLAVVWLLTGIWHGNGFNYVIWGVVLGIMIILEKLVYGKYLQKIPILGNLYVLVLIPLTWVVFAITDLKQLGIYFGRLFPLFGDAGIAVNQQDIFKYLSNYGIYLVAGIILCIPAVSGFYEKHRKNPVVIVLLAIVFWLSVYFLSSSAGNPFMYLNF
ncbi:MAG: MBOAT family O-acyltransferase [Lachnospiraceae bacterium]|nr:MBOAT family O-acyltransferase [Lachnospiraceae bacterium]